jgi:hypothetical protein
VQLIEKGQTLVLFVSPTCGSWVMSDVKFAKRRNFIPNSLVLHQLDAVRIANTKRKKSQDCSKIWLKPITANFLDDKIFCFSSISHILSLEVAIYQLIRLVTGHFSAWEGAVAICQVDRLCMTRQDCQRSACLDMHMLCTLAQYRSGLTIYFFISKSGSSY